MINLNIYSISRQLSIPIIITKRGRNSILLNEERIAVVNNNYEIVINEQDDIEFELTVMNAFPFYFFKVKFDKLKN